ncbi:MAG: hypothetical protein KatS3mg057_2073 [Herpetosiphonaceae bacterium]|nr:MAG: hypothetical protein KatS3mg057_2073 [Herpetosiphonaceae bacterium]
MAASKTIAQLVDNLFLTYRHPPEHREWFYAEVSREIERLTGKN